MHTYESTVSTINSTPPQKFLWENAPLPRGEDTIRRDLFPPDGRITPFVLSLSNIINLSDVSFLSLAWSGLALFPGYQGSCGIVRNGAAGLILSFKIRQRLKCWHVASTPTLTMWLLCSNCVLPWTTEILGVFSKTNTAQLQQRSLMDPRPSGNFLAKCINF